MGRGRGVREREGAERGERVRLGYLSMDPEFLVMPLIIIIRVA